MSERIKTLLPAGVLAAGAWLAPGVQAAPSSFFLDYSGADFSNNAVAHGILTIDDATFPAGSDWTFLIPGEQITGLSLTITGAASGNGTFGLDAFDSFAWSTTGADYPLDLSEELVGQPTLGGGWGTVHDAQGSTGDFNPFALDGTGAPSAAGLAFTLATDNGTGDRLNLVSFRPVPLPASLWLFAPAISGLLALGRRKAAA